VVVDQGDRVHRSPLDQGVVEDLPQVVVLLLLARVEEVGLETRVEARELGVETLAVGDERVDGVFPELSDAERLALARVSSSDVLAELSNERLLGVRTLFPAARR